MNIHAVLGDDHSFDPDEIAVMVLAYENALRELRLADREPATLTVSHRLSIWPSSASATRLAYVLPP